MNKFIIILFLAMLFPTMAVAIDTVDINNASLSQLDAITGIGPAMAQRIIDARPFSSVDDLDRVKGVGVKTLQKIKDQGVACVGCQTQIAEIVQPTKETSPVADITPVIYPSGIFINELLPNPSGADETNEWIELYNSNNVDIDLSGWQIQDTEGTPTTYTIAQNIKILANGYSVFKRPDTKIMLNNDVDGLNLLTPDKKIVDSVNYIKAPLGQSYNKTSSGWAFSTTTTPGVTNIITVAQNKLPGKALSKTKNSVNNDLTTQGLADISQNINTNQIENKDSPWFLFFIVLAITIILAIIILFIKNKNYVRT